VDDVYKLIFQAAQGSEMPDQPQHARTWLEQELSFPDTCCSSRNR
jgi:hypothetical protein